MNGNELIAQILQREGVEWMACFPNNPLIEAVAKVGIRPIAFRHERGAVMAADGFSRISGRQRFGVVAVQSQAGAENALGGIAQSYADNIPILVLPGGVNRSEISVRPNYSAVTNYAGVVKSVEVVSRRPTSRRHASGLRRAAQRRPGPVVVELTADVCRAECPTRRSRLLRRPGRLAEPEPERDGRASTLLGPSEPVLWAGGGVLFADADRRAARAGRADGNAGLLHHAGQVGVRRAHPALARRRRHDHDRPAPQWLGEPTCCSPSARA